MENFIKEFSEFLKDYSMSIVLLIVGALGAAYSISISDVKLSKTQKFVSIVFGGITSMIVSPGVSWFVFAFTDKEMNPAAIALVGYVSGHIGLKGTTGFLFRMAKRKDNKSNKS